MGKGEGMAKSESEIMGEVYDRLVEKSAQFLPLEHAQALAGAILKVATGGKAADYQYLDDVMNQCRELIEKELHKPKMTEM